MDKKMAEIKKAFKRIEDYGRSLDDINRQFAPSSKDDEFQELFWDLINLLRQNGFYKEAFICTEQLITCTDDPEPLAQLYMTLGQFMENMNDFEAAILYYLHAKSLKPADKMTAYLVHNNLGYCFNLLGRHEEAEGYCRTAINIDAELHNAYKNLGIALHGKGRLADAARNFIKAVDAYPADPRAHDLLRRLVEQHGEISIEIPDIRQQVARCGNAIFIGMIG